MIQSPYFIDLITISTCDTIHEYMDTKTKPVG